jgi:Ni/Co efflux regulator RcnB
MAYPCAMRSLLRTSLVLALLLAAPMMASAQEGISRKKQEKVLARKEKADAKAKVRKGKEDRKRHLSIQDKETRKRIKRHTRRADRHGTGVHRDGFPRSLFQRRR